MHQCGYKKAQVILSSATFPKSTNVLESVFGGAKVRTFEKISSLSSFGAQGLSLYLEPKYCCVNVERLLHTFYQVIKSLLEQVDFFVFRFSSPV